MKKIALLGVTALSVLSLAACSSNSTSTTKSKSQESSTKAAKIVSDNKLFDNQQITISYNSSSNYFTIKNKTTAPINLINGRGPILNGHTISTVDGFGSVFIAANSSSEETIRLLKEAQTIDGDKINEYDYVKKGDNLLHVAGDILDETYHNIGSYSFDVHVDSKFLKN
ncbi:hypothetical protein LMG8520_0643 [Lactococcus lactis subsp. lactis]|uniref:Lipoprotein n=2 Tax=Lactococcus lactis TaxID=1358 RepID=A0A2A5SCX2_LACLH|nr:hypothetical protein [Lactococcus lactis]KAA8704000.1 hypothetical protein F4V48_03560 [Lactococcus lactis subsp. hordniae]KSU12774.1 hypothetical protein LMG8520_0643 [Lactococcus lactis subsp. lactis]MCT3135341.1 hypothetical protein [Lactococcus lactis]PCS11290.1 hypothetical protein RU90_GL000772 [Lactococcus lactis subsp. hordniae]